jgi:hypothetical protein
MKVSPFIIVGLASLVEAGKKRDGNYPIEVSLKAQEGSVVRVKISNQGGYDINLFSRATILDPNPVHKLNLTTVNGKLSRSD